MTALVDDPVAWEVCPRWRSLGTVNTLEHRWTAWRQQPSCNTNPRTPHICKALGDLEWFLAAGVPSSPSSVRSTGTGNAWANAAPAVGEKACVAAGLGGPA